ncbi:MAG: penicillin-binding protein activator LpoB [Planctomycetota bacterium]
MTNTALKITLAAALGFTIVGCRDTAARKIDPFSEDQAITSVRGIDPKDANEAALTLVDSLLRHPAITRFGPEDPAILAISSVRANISDRQFDVDQVNKTIRVELNRSGRVLTTTVGSLGNEDVLASEAAEADQFLNGTSPTVPADYTLSGKIIENYTRAGDFKQSVYIFQMSLTDSRGLALWEDEVAIGKKGTRNRVGF